jgi:hypothetical protein
MWWRTRDQLVAETRLLAEVLAAAESDVIVSQAPSKHLYGYLAGSLMPALTGLPVVSWPVGGSFPAGWRRPLIVAIPATWWGLDHCLPTVTACEQVSVMHSTARLPDVARSVCQAVRGLRLTELHGSTETGLVGLRRGGDALSGGAFTLAPDVSFAPGMPLDRVGRLAVSSQRLAIGDHGEASTMDDVVQVLSARTYLLMGRTRLVKVNGRRIDLEVVERQLRSAVPDVPLACEPVPHAIRGEWFDVLVEGPESARRRVDVASRVLSAAHPPRAVRRVPRVSAPRHLPAPDEGQLP